MKNTQNVLITGCNGLIGKNLSLALLKKGFIVTGVGTRETSEIKDANFNYMKIDLTNYKKMKELFQYNDFSHVIHLAAIAHVFKGRKISWSKYYRINTLVSRSIFKFAAFYDIPVFFSSTVDVYGIKEKVINENSKPEPIGFYSNSKLMAEKNLMDMHENYLIARFAPIYTEENKRDIQKRYYIKYPNIAFLIGEGKDYEFLHIDNAIKFILGWVLSPYETSQIINVMDLKRHNTKDLIKEEKKQSKAKKVIWLPEISLTFIYILVNLLLSKRSLLKFTAYKIIKPMKFDRKKINEFLNTTDMNY